MSELEVEAPEPEPSPEPTPEPTPEPEAWAGPSQEEWEQTQAQLAQANEFLNYLQTPSYPEESHQEQQLPVYDPFDPESSQAYFEARDQRLLGTLQQMLSPVLERESNESASQWAEQTFSRLGVPEDQMWQEAVLFTSAGFQQYDPYGRPLVHPQQAAAHGYQFLQRFADHVREQERTALRSGEAQQDQALRNRAGAPDIPSGPAGGEGFPEGMDEIAAARMWRDRQVS
jgi:hypothetical protein